MHHSPRKSNSYFLIFCVAGVLFGTLLIVILNYAIAPEGSDKKLSNAILPPEIKFTAIDKNGINVTPEWNFFQGEVSLFDLKGKKSASYKITITEYDSFLEKTRNSSILLYNPWKENPALETSPLAQIDCFFKNRTNEKVKLLQIMQIINNSTLRIKNFYGIETEAEWQYFSCNDLEYLLSQFSSHLTK